MPLAIPIANVVLTVTLPDASERQVTTDSSGMAKVSSAKPGEIALTCNKPEKTWQQTALFVTTGEQPSSGSEAEPNQDWIKDIQCIAMAATYQAQQGDTLQSIATANGVSEDQIAQFNWGGTGPQTVKEGMQAAGARQADKAGNEFFGKDDAGTVWVPDDWLLAGLPTGQGGLRTHVLRVARLVQMVAFDSLQWSQDQTPVDEPIQMLFNVKNHKPGDEVSIHVYEWDSNGDKQKVETVTVALERSELQSFNWMRSSEEAASDLANDQSQGDSGPLTYRFELEMNGRSHAEASGPLWLSKDVVVSAKYPDDAPVPDGTTVILHTADGQQLSARTVAGQVTFEDVFVGSVEIEIPDMEMAS